ncbi:hypothetical protein BT67DRAFT_385777 [Trichocladium antarcticum]|uniref:DNA polymerase lambda n=1 Tax=Trichocladium antarcticum TaxID=1450529 RepID=A0AAN6ZCE1_9PEZI|nr:hypothetical protein BT67DRAFT_385777 [Trichocladium antarcticum]
MDSPSLQDKTAFFAGLDALDNVNDRDDMVDKAEQDHRDKCRAFFKSRKRAKPVPENPAASMPGQTVIESTPHTRRITVSSSRAGRLLRSTTSFVEETPVPETARPPFASLRRSTTLPTGVSSAPDQSPSATTALKKRKRQSSRTSGPEAPQVFRNLFFYYIPDNDIAPARKLRMARAQEHGAQRVRDLSSASHVIVDKQLKYKDIENMIGSDAPTSLVIVTEDYPIECISFRTLLNPDQTRYRVAGHRVPPLQVKEQRATRRRDTSPEDEHSALQSDTRDVDDHPRNHPLGHLPGPPPSPPRQGLPPPGSSAKDELSEYIELMQLYKHLPLDDEEGDQHSVMGDQGTVSDSDDEEGSEAERARKKSKAKPRRGAQKDIPFEERFACHRGGTKDNATDVQNPNARTIEILQSMCDYYTRISDNWRTMAYRRAITTLRRQPVKIATAEEAHRLPNIGARLAAKIEEIVSTNRLRRLEYAHAEPLDRVLATFLQIHDVGPRRAAKWIAQGHRTLADLAAHADLTANQRLGIDHHTDLTTRIPRAEVTALFTHVQRAAARIDPAAELLIGGSHRRGAASSGDIDIIITKKATSSPADLGPLLTALVADLTRTGFLVATLAAPHTQQQQQQQQRPGSKWHGCCVLPRADGGAGPRPVWRRIDLLLVPETEYGAALIYFTGNDIFNRSMRLLASKKGMRLNQRGLYQGVLRGKGRVRVTEGELVEGRDERRIFALLGVKWREPWERWC